MNPDRSYSKLLYSHGVIPDVATYSGYATDGYTKITTAPLRFILSGYHQATGTNINSRGTRGEYWSSSSGTTTNAYSLNFYSSGVYPQYSGGKRGGYVVRCLAL